MPLTIKPASGSGSATLISVAGTTTNDTLTLPAKTGNIITSADSGTVTAAMLASGAAKSNFGSGTVLQVVNANYSSAVTNNTSTMVSTGLTASITPTSSTNKILIIASISSIYKQTNNTSAILQLYRGAGNIFQFEYTGGANNSTNVNCYTSATTYLDAPATTSSTTYTVYFASQQNNAGITVQLNGGASTITLLEIAA